MYLNTLICLEENVTGYSKNGAQVTGHITITSPGIVKCYVQNLRQLPKEYTVYLMSKKQNKAARLGSMNVCEGNKQVTWKVDLNNIKGTGLKGADIDSAAVVVEGDSIGNTDTILIGYTAGKYLITSMLESALPKKSTPVPKPAPKPAQAAQPKPAPKVEPTTTMVMPQPQPEPVGGPGPVIVPQPKPECGPGPVPMPQLQPAGGPGPVIMPQPEQQGGPGPVIIPQPQQEPVGEPGPVIMPQPQPQPEQQGGPGPVIVPQAKPEYGPGPVIIPQPQQEPVGGPGPVIMSQPQPKPACEPGPMIMPQPQPEQQGGPGPVIVPQAKPEYGPGPVIIPQPQAKPECEPGPVIVTQPQSQPAGGPGPVIMPQAQPQPKPACSPGSVTMPQTKPECGPGPVIIPQAQPQAKPACEPGPVIIPQAQPQAKPACEPGPVIMPQAQPQPKPAYEPEPVIVPQPKQKYEPVPVVMPQPEQESEPAPMVMPEPVVLPEVKTEKCDTDKCNAKKCGPNKCECKIYVPTSEEGDVTEVEILRGLQEAFSRTTDKGDLAKKVERIISESVNPIPIPTPVRAADNKVDEEEAYLSQIESVLKNIQNNIGEELQEKKTPPLEDDEVSIYKRNMARVRDIFNESSAIEPFADKDAHTDWVRISISELISMPQLSYEWCTNPVITYCYHKFGFLILGKDKDIEQYYVGIPDIYDTKREFILSIDKIEAFRGRTDEQLKPGDYGYWIARL